MGKEKACHDRTTSALVALQEKDVVRMKGPGSWDRRAIVLQQVASRSYNVMTENGDVFHRNRRHLLKTTATTEDDLSLVNRLNKQGTGARVQRDEGHDSDNVTEVPCHDGRVHIQDDATAYAATQVRVDQKACS
ncbi:hypothetical protein PAMP_004231 [Pampus punctatissimus]